MARLLPFIVAALFLSFCVGFSESTNANRGACHIAESLDVFMNEVGKEIGHDVTTFIKTLKDNWITTVDALEDVTDAQFHDMSFPIALINSIRARVKQLCCSFTCEHGGIPAPTCDHCINCLGAWTGTHCDTWDKSVPKDGLVKALQLIALNATENDNANKAKHPLPSSIGRGVDITTGQLRLPIVSLSYQDTHRSWTNSKGNTFIIPGEATFSPSQTGIYTPSQKSYVFENMRDYTGFLFGTHSAAGGLFSQYPEIQTIYDKYFNGDNSLAVSQSYYDVYVLDLPIDPSTKVRNYQLDHFAQRALDFLPPSYDTDTDKALYRTFVANWGTSYAVNTHEGGLLEMLSFFETRLIIDGTFTEKQIEGEVKIDFDNVLGTGSGTAVNKGYAAHRKVSSLGCLGGNAAEVCSANSLDKWAKTLDQAPQTISFTLADFTELIQDDAKRGNIQRAVQAYIQEQQEKWAQGNKCPQCVWGTCASPAQICTCENNHITGRLCDVCKDGWGGTKCVTPLCDPSCKHGTCTAPNQCSCATHYAGADCSTCENGWGGKDCKSPICSHGCGHGSCTAPETCKCDSRHTGATCSQCISGWSGDQCTIGQNCFECGGSGKICNSMGCQYGTQSCPGCAGSGQVPSDVVRCFKCGGRGTVCNSMGCTYGMETCPACHQKGYVPAGSKRCPKCGGSGTVCNSMGCQYGSNSCPTCHGMGYV